MNTKDVQGNLEFQKIHDTQSLKVEFGHTISIYHHIVLATCWKYSRSWERLMFANRRRKWRISMWTRRFGVYSCLSRFKLTRLFDEFTIRQESILETCGTIVPDNWEVDQKADGDRRIVHVWLEPANLENHHYCVTELFEFWIPKPASFPTRRFTREASVQNQFNLEKTMKWYLENRSLEDLDRIDGEPMEFEWTICPGFATLWILNEIQNMMAELQCKPEQFQGRIIFMSMLKEFVWVNSRKWRQLYGEFHECRCMCQEASQMVNGTKLLKSWCSTLLRVRYFSPPVREEVNWKVKEVERSPFTSTEAKKPLVNSVNQPSIHGVVADLCKELDPDSRNHNEGLWWCRLRFPMPTPYLRVQHHWHRETCCKVTKGNSQKLLMIRNCQIVKTVQRCWFLEEDQEGTVLHCNWTRICDYADSMSSQEDGFVQIQRSVLSWMWNSIFTEDVITLISWWNQTLVSTNTSQKSQRKYRVRMLTRPSARRNQWQRLKQSQDLLWIQMSMFLFLREMDGRWSTTIRSSLFWSVKNHDQNIATWLFISSRRKRSSESWRSDREIQGRNWCYFAVDSWYLGECFGKRRRREKEISMLLESSLFE